MNSPHVLSFSANDTTGKTTRFTVGTDIIDYMESSRTFGREDLSDPNADGRFQRRMVAIPDKKWNVVTPMVLTISNQNQLYLVRKDDESENGDGWKLIDLSQAFKGIVGNSVRVRAHAAGWTDHDRITIAVAVDDGSSESSRVFVAYDLSSRTSNWENISWIDCGSREDIRVEGIRVLDGGDGSWTVVLAGDRGPNDTLYLLRSNLQKSFAQALVFNPAVTLEEILDFEVAVHPTLGAGIAVLGINGGTRDLSFRPFPAYKADGSFSTIPPVEPLPCPASANVLESGLTKVIQKGRRKTYMGSDIYVGGQGVHLIQASDVLKVVINGGAIPLTVVTSPDAAPNVQDLIVGEAPDGSTSVWSLLQNGDLNTVKKVSANAAWGEPLRLRVGIQAIAPVHGDEHLTTSLLVVYANGQASFLVRDASQGIWQERPLTVANPEEVSAITCYGTTLRVLSEGSLPQIGTKIKVSASVLSSVVLNGNAVFIGPNVSFETETDFNGSIKLFDRVRSLTPAIYRFEIEGFNECIDVNPAAGMHERFQFITADELQSATISTAKGDEPLLPESFRTGADTNKVDMLAGSLNQLSSLTNSASGVVAGVSLVNPDQPFSSALHPEVAPDDYRWGIQAGENGVSTISNSVLDQIIHAGESVGNFFKNLGEGIADFFEGLAQGFKEGGLKGGLTFVLYKAKEGAEKAWQFVCKIGNEIKRFAIKTWEEISGAFKWLWEQVKIGVEKIWEYLKFVFDWQDILRVRDAMVDMVGEAFDYAESAIDTLKEQVAGGIDSLTEQIETWRTEAGEVPKKVQKASPGKSFLNTISQVTEPIQDVIDQVTGNTVVSWVTDKVGELFDEIIEFDTPDASPGLIDAVTDFFEGAVSDTIDELWNTFSQIQEDAANRFAGDFPDISSMNFETIQNLLVSISAGALQGFLKLIKNLILQSLDLVKKLIGFVRNALFTKIRFPFIEKLVKLVSLGTISIDTSFTFVEAIALIVAIPTTIGYKLIFGESPLKPGDTLAFPYGAITVQSGTEDALKLSGRVTKLFFTFLRLLTTGIKLGTKVMKLDMVIERIKWLDFFSMVFGGLSYCGSVLNFAASKTWEFASPMFAIDSLNYFIPTAISCLQWKVTDKDQWKAITAKNKKITACTTACHLALRCADFGIQADEFGSIDKNSERAKIAGFVAGATSGLSSFCAALSTLYKDKKPDGTQDKIGRNRQILFDSLSLGLSVAAFAPGIVEVCYL